MKDNHPVKYPIGIQDFPSIRERGYLYVDKTALIHDLVSTGDYYFLSRPRRFGKSLLLSTLKAYFEGRKELFEGLAISRLEKEWKRYPVFLFSMATFNPSDVTSIGSIIDEQLSRYERKLGLCPCAYNFNSRLSRLIREAHEKSGQRAIILIDEYDNPLISTLDNNKHSDYLRETLKSFYTVIKDMSEHLRFGMLTGVTRFSRLTIFSGLNNLQDITLDDRFAAICGITREEMEANFSQGITAMGERHNWSYSETLQQLKDYYDGYHFTAESPDIFNPFSLLNAFVKLKFENYWFATGVPTFLVKQLKRSDTDLRRFMNQSVTSSVLSEIDSGTDSIVATLFQAGFLTIKSYDERRRQYTLGIPNAEVDEGMQRLFMQQFLDPDVSRGHNVIFDLIDAADDGNPQKFLTLLQSFLASVPFDLSKGSREVYFQNAFYIISSLIGLNAKAEHHTSNGSIDLLIETTRFLYLFEFKLDRPALEAIAQINNRDYALQWQADDRKLYKIGVEFSSEQRNVKEWIIDSR